MVSNFVRKEQHVRVTLRQLVQVLERKTTRPVFDRLSQSHNRILRFLHVF